MKASLKFKDEQNPPILRLKVPLNILGFPFQSGVSASTDRGDSKDLSLNLSTFFESGPSFKLVYKPNDSWNPFALVVKTGIGPFGSPISAPLSMSAEFNLLSKANPTFFLRFNPQFGDFGIKKASASTKKSNLGEKTSGAVSAVSDAVSNVFDGVEVSAKTELPIRNRAVVKFNWGIRISEEMKSDVINCLGIGVGDSNLNRFGKIPFLVMNKISIEHVDSKKGGAEVAAEVEEVRSVAMTWRQLDVLHGENESLRRAVEELRSEIGGGKLSCGGGGAKDSGKYMRGVERKVSKFDGFPGKVKEEDVNEEEKKGVGNGN